MTRVCCFCKGNGPGRENLKEADFPTRRPTSQGNLSDGLHTGYSPKQMEMTSTKRAGVAQEEVVASRTVGLHDVTPR